MRAQLQRVARQPRLLAPLAAIPAPGMRQHSTRHGATVRHLLAHNNQGTELTVDHTGTRDVVASEEMKGAAERWQGRAEVQLVLHGAAA
jgi:hypothetical protein